MYLPTLNMKKQIHIFTVNCKHRNKGLFILRKKIMFTFLIFTFNYKNSTIFHFVSCFQKICVVNNENNRKLFLLFPIQIFKNRKQNKNKIAFTFSLTEQAISVYQFYFLSSDGIKPKFRFDCNFLNNFNNKCIIVT